jgi:hypothetical protein
MSPHPTRPNGPKLRGFLLFFFFICFQKMGKSILHSPTRYVYCHLKICTQCFCFQYTCQVIMPFMVPELCPCLLLLGHLCPMRRRRGHDRMVVGFTTIYAIVISQDIDLEG